MQDNDILNTINNLRDSLWAQHGDVLAKNSELHDRVRMTYYVGRLMQERGHKPVLTGHINATDKLDCAYYSEKALQEAFEAGRHIHRISASQMRRDILAELKQEMIYSIENL